MHSQLTTHGVVLQITQQERHALQLLANGDTPSEVADVLGISTPETETLLTRLFAAIGAATRIDAAVCS